MTIEGIAKPIWAGKYDENQDQRLNAKELAKMPPNSARSAILNALSDDGKSTVLATLDILKNLPEGSDQLAKILKPESGDSDDNKQTINGIRKELGLPQLTEPKRTITTTYSTNEGLSAQQRLGISNSPSVTKGSNPHKTSSPHGTKFSNPNTNSIDSFFDSSVRGKSIPKELMGVLKSTGLKISKQKDNNVMVQTGTTTANHSSYAPEGWQHLKRGEIAVVTEIFSGDNATFILKAEERLELAVNLRNKATEGNNDFGKATEAYQNLISFIETKSDQDSLAKDRLLLNAHYGMEKINKATSNADDTHIQHRQNNEFWAWFK